MKLVKKLLFIVLTVFIVAISIVSFYLFRTVSDTLEKNISDKQVIITRSLLDTVDRYIIERIHDIKDLSKDTDSILVLSEHPIESNLPEHIVTDHFTPLLHAQRHVMNNLLIADETGKIIVSSNNQISQISGNILQNIFSQALTGKSVFSDIYLDENTHKPTMTIAEPIYNEEKSQSRVIGVMIGNIYWQNIIEIFAGFKDTNIYLYNYKNDLIASNSDDHNQLLLKENHSSAKVLVYSNQGPKEGSITELNHEHIESLASYAKELTRSDYLGNGWTLVMETPIKVAYAESQRIVLRIVFISALIVIISLFIVSLFVHKLVIYPIVKIMESVNRITGGNFNEVIWMKGNDEIALLASSINNMTAKLKLLYHNLQLVVDKKTEELSAKIKFIESQNIQLSEAKIDLEKFKLAVEDAPIHIIITDVSGIILYANKSSQKTTGYGKYEMIGSKPSLWGNQMDKEIYENMWNIISNNKQTYRGIVTNKRRNGQLYSAEVQISPVINNRGQVVFYVGIEEDVTTKQRIDRMKSDFISLTAHQLRTPLTAIKWLLEMFVSENGSLLTSRQIEQVKKIVSSNERMISLVSILLNISRIESGRLAVNPEPTNMKILVNEIIDEVKVRYMNKSHLFVFDFAENIPNILLDEKIIRNIYLNLLTNSCKYSEPKSPIKIRMWIENGNLVSEIKDQGCGIPSHQQMYIFNRFFRADNVLSIDTDGSGLGLYLCKLITNNIGGKIWFESTEGVGSTFWFTLPLSGMTVKKGEVRID
jgi:PAS domain S-box-containing protein